jgi:hypothetical protein
MRPRNKLKTLKWQEENILRLLVNRAKHRAILKDLEFSITHEDLIVPSVCPILQIPLEIVRGQGRGFNHPSLDRIDNTKGYTKENVWIISDLANKMKTDASIEQLKQFGRWTVSL